MCILEVDDGVDCALAIRSGKVYRLGSDVAQDVLDALPEEYQGTLVYAIPPDVTRRTRRRSLRLPVGAMAARAAWLVDVQHGHKVPLAPRRG